MFALSDLFEHAVDVPQTDGEAADFRSLSGREYAFPVQGIRSVKLPKDISALSDLLAGADEAAALVALTHPQTRIPITDPAKGLRGFAVGVAINHHGREFPRVTGESEESPWPNLVLVTVMICDGKRRYDPIEIRSAQVLSISEPDEMIEQMARLYVGAAPEARKAFRGVSSVWLGGSPGEADHLIGTAAAGGLQMECIAEPSRHLRTIKDRLGAKPPDCLIVWQPRAEGTDGLVTAYRAMRPDGEVIELQEYETDDVGVEFAMALQELGYVSPDLVIAKGSTVSAPAGGEERFYIKLYGRKTGDVMKEVADCGHDRWGADQRRKAPRAYKGILHQFGHQPTKLFLCAICSKHRWRARF